MSKIPIETLMTADNIRKLAARTVETYPTEWKVVHEALQNAKDAIRRANRAGTVQIELDVVNQTVLVKDDGIGFPYNTDLLGFGGTDKDSDTDWCLNGRQGVGLKAVILSTSTFSLSASSDGKCWQARIDDADKYLEGDNPEFEICEPAPCKDPPGTAVSYSFRGPLVSEVVNAILSEQLPRVHEALASTPRKRIELALESYFRSYTYAGDVNTLLGIGEHKQMAISLAIVANGTPTGIVPAELMQELQNGRITITFPNRHWDVREAVDRTRSGMPRPTVLGQALPPGGVLGRYSDSYIYTAALTSEDQFASLLENPNLRRPIDKAKYRSLFSSLRGIYVAVGSGGVLGRYVVGPPRQFVAADGIPSAHVLPGPTRGGEASYVSNNIHFIANVKAQLNYGKQTIPNPRLVGLVSDYFADAVRATLRNVAISIVGSQVVTTSGDDLEDQFSIDVDVISRPELAHGLLNFKRVPRDENALIAIFFELLGQGHLKGYHFYSLSQKARYDGRAAIMQRGRDEVPTPSADSDLKYVEFKLDVNEVIDDFENETKLPQDISLLIVWDDTLKPEITDYQVVDIEYTGDADRAMHAVDKVLHCKRHNRMIQMLVINDVINRIANGR